MDSSPPRVDWFLRDFQSAFHNLAVIVPTYRSMADFYASKGYETGSAGLEEDCGSLQHLHRRLTGRPDFRVRLFR